MFKILSTIGTLLSDSAEAKGKRGEMQSSFFLTMGLNSSYKLYHDVTLHTSDNATTQIDHIIISPFGVFVIEIKNFSGWIFGSEKQYKWTQSLPNKTKNQFLNPLIQNKKHVQAIQALFGLDDNQVFSMVVFMEKAVFKTDLPSNVMHLSNMRRHIQGFKTVLFNEKQIKSFDIKLNNRRLSRGQVADTVHMSHINRKKVERERKQHQPLDSTPKKSQTKGATFQFTDNKIANEKHTDKPPMDAPDPLTCPRCGDQLVKRVVKKGKNAGHTFYGCKAFPKCRFTKAVDSEAKPSNS